MHIRDRMKTTLDLLNAARSRQVNTPWQVAFVISKEACCLENIHLMHDRSRHKHICKDIRSE